MSRVSRPKPLIEFLESRQMLARVGAPVEPAPVTTTPTATAPATPGPTATAAVSTSAAGRQIETLGRGVVAVSQGGGTNGKVYVSWRLLATDPDEVMFNLYRSTNNGTPVKVKGLIAATTDYQDSGVDLAKSNAYYVKPVINGVEGVASTSFILAPNSAVQQYLKIPLQIPAGGTTLSGEAYTYGANDSSVGDLDGDGEYEYIVKWDPTNAKDNSQGGYTGNVYLDAYKLSGKRLWRIDLGKNIRAGAHYTQFQVFDYDGDGKAELVCKTADGTVDGLGKVIGSATADYRTSNGYILSGPEFLTVFNGLTGAAMGTANYDPPRGSVSSWGDGYGNRVDRFLAGTAYLDGKRPSIIMSRGYYTRTVIAAWDWRDGKLTKRWTFDSNASGNSTYAGQGSHSLSIADVDQDGKDEIIFGSMTVDDNGRGLWNTRFGHGDAQHVSDLDPARPGLEVFKVSESANQPSSWMADAKTGEVIWQSAPNGDNGRGVSADIWAGNPGAESWSGSDPGGGIRDVKGNTIPNAARPSSTNFLVWWDGDATRELLDKTYIDKYGAGRIFTAYQKAPIKEINGTKSTPNLSGDVLGDWREEVIWRAEDNTALYLFTTTTPAQFRLDTLMHDTTYREGIAWQNTAYNQPPHTGFHLGDGMLLPPSAPANLTATGAVTQINLAWTHAGTTEDGFKVLRSTDGVNFTEIALLGANVTQYADTAASAGTRYTYRVRAYNAAGGSFFTNNAVASTTAVSWTSQDVGNVGIAGSTTNNGGVYTIKASGADVWGSADGFRYTYASLSGDGEIVARVTGLQNTSGWAKAGVMIREDLTVGSKHAFALLAGSSSNGGAFQYRPATNGTSLQSGGNASGMAAPQWVKLVRSGNSFTAFRSADGFGWTQMGAAVTIAMGANVHAGLAVTSHNTAALTTSTIESAKVTQASGSTSATSLSSTTPTVNGLSSMGSTAQTTGASGFGVRSAVSLLSRAGLATPKTTIVDETASVE